MPKLFKPKIGGLASKKQAKPTEKAENPQPLLNSEKSPNAKKQATEKAEKTAVSPPKDVIPKSPTHKIQKKSEKPKPGTPVKVIPNKRVNVDIDAVTPDVPEETPSDAPTPITLFTPKQQPKKQRTVYGEPPPPTDKPLDRSTVTLRSLLNWVPAHKPPPKIRELNLTPEPPKKSKGDERDDQSPKEADEKPSDSPAAPTADMKGGSVIDPFAPQVRLDADGNIVLDERSLEVARPGDEDGMGLNRRHVAEEAGLYGTTYNSFRRQPVSQRGRKWSERDTTRFYRALSTMGTDFYCMTKLFPDRTRTQLLKKFKREERLFPHLVDDALKNKRNYDVSVFYATESDKEEEYEKLAKEAINEKRKAAAKEKRAKAGSPKKTSMDDINALIDEVLAQDFTAENSQLDRDMSNKETSAPNRPTRSRNAASLTAMIDHAAKRVSESKQEKAQEKEQTRNEGEKQDEESPSKKPAKRRRIVRPRTDSSTHSMAVDIMQEARSKINL